MTKRIVLLWIIGILILTSCKDKYGRIAGYWEASFNDSINFPRQILFFEKDKGNLKLIIDEPSAYMFGMPGEKPYYINDSLYYESLWGLYKYYGKFASGKSIIHGTRVFNNAYFVPFTMKRISVKNLVYKIPRINDQGKRDLSYKYSKPLQRDDGISCSTLPDVVIDSTYIYKLVQDILKGKMSTIHSLLIAKDNKLVLEEYFHTYDYYIPHELQSVT